MSNKQDMTLTEHSAIIPTISLFNVEALEITTIPANYLPIPEKQIDGHVNIAFKNEINKLLGDEQSNFVTEKREAITTHMHALKKLARDKINLLITYNILRLNITPPNGK
eukprot:15317266-Ditylum_brightwellii.AAC.1